MTNAVSAAALLNTLGINTHLDFDAYGYQTLATVESNIDYLGVKIIRDSAETATDAQTWLQVAQATDAKFDDYIAEASPAGMATDLGYVTQLAQEGILASVEGGDEEDDSYPASLGNTLPITAQFQQQVYALGHQLGLPVINMSFGAGWTAANDWEGDYGAVGSLAAFATDANAHTYPNAGQLPDDAIQQINALAEMADAGQPVFTTEIGWSTSVFSEAAIAKYVLDAAMDGIKDGDTGMYFYGLYDDGSGNWGMFNANGTPRPAAIALHDLTSLLADTGANAATFKPGSLNETLSGTQTGDNSVLIEKSNGSFWLSLWNETEAANSPHTITVNLGGQATTVVEYDPLTGISNRRHITQYLDQEVARARRHQLPLSLVMLDIDHFKHINDTWGHPAGDQVLQQAAHELNDVLRQHDSVGRYGGEEFMLVLAADASGAAVLAERCRQRLEDMSIVLPGGDRISMTASFGICTLSPGIADAEAMIRLADAALYSAKDRGRNRVETAASPVMLH